RTYFSIGDLLSLNSAYSVSNAFYILGISQFIRKTTYRFPKTKIILLYLPKPHELAWSEYTFCFQVPYFSKKRRNFLGLKKKKKNEQKVQYHSGVTAGKLQMQVDDFLEKVTEKSIDLLAQKHAELQQCEFLGEEILQSKHFQLASKRTMRMYKLKHMHFP
ncbi:chromosome 3 orf 49, partial [Chelydra serpentina]